MVAQITEGTAFDKRGRPFRRRNYLPGILVLVALAVVTLLVWLMALSQPPDVHEAAVCNAPPPPADPTATAPQLGEQVSRQTMTDVNPAKLADTKIHVLNASGQGGQAAEVAGELRDLGYAEPAAANDTLYANTRLECQGQIRFGPSGRAAAAAAWLVAPCTELFQDQRSDGTVDLAIGTEFS
ncbi:MAG TPA: envelope integrity protein Cei, partial [Mycobacterium sp.]|nr:envelope integrity protein Cei [Mycobacterium sp.]